MTNYLRTDNEHPCGCYESVLYFHRRGLLIKFDGLYWYWSSLKRNWVSDENYVKENWNIRNLIYTSEKEVKKYIRNSLRVSP